MRTWKDLKSISIPDCMSHLPLDARGYPIPYSVLAKTNGTPDFRVIDQVKWVQCVVYRLCALTGHPLKDRMAFVGGPLSMQSRCFTDAAMLPEAAEYAIQVCPFLAAPKFGYAKMIAAETGTKLTVNNSMSLARPEKFGLGITTGYRTMLHHGEDMIRADEFLSVEFWKEGVKL